MKAGAIALFGGSLLFTYQMFTKEEEINKALGMLSHHTTLLLWILIYASLRQSNTWLD